MMCGTCTNSTCKHACACINGYPACRLFPYTSPPLLPPQNKNNTLAHPQGWRRSFGPGIVRCVQRVCRCPRRLAATSPRACRRLCQDSWQATPGTLSAALPFLGMHSPFTPLLPSPSFLLPRPSPFPLLLPPSSLLPFPLSSGASHPLIMAAELFALLYLPWLIEHFQYT